MMHEPEKSDPCIVAMKLTNDGAGATLESVERRQGAKGNTGKTHTHRTPSRVSVSPGLERVESEQDSRRRNGSLLCFTTSILIYSGRRFPG